MFWSEFTTPFWVGMRSELSICLSLRLKDFSCGRRILGTDHYLGLVWAPLSRELSFLLPVILFFEPALLSWDFWLFRTIPRFHREVWLSVSAVREHWERKGLFQFLIFWVVQCHGKARAVPFSPDQDFNCVTPRTSIARTTPKSSNESFHRTPRPRIAQGSYSQLWSEIGYKPEPLQLFSWSDKEET